MRQTSGIIINNDIFINSSHVVKIDKDIIETILDNYSDSDSSNVIIEYTINIYMTNSKSPIVIHFDDEKDRDVIFNKIVMELYGNNYAYVNF
jgi:hypothetical protein